MTTTALLIYNNKFYNSNLYLCSRLLFGIDSYISSLQWPTQTSIHTFWLVSFTMTLGLALWYLLVKWDLSSGVQAKPELMLWIGQQSFSWKAFFLSWYLQIPGNILFNFVFSFLSVCRVHLHPRSNI